MLLSYYRLGSARSGNHYWPVEVGGSVSPRTGSQDPDALLVLIDQVSLYHNSTTLLANTMTTYLQLVSNEDLA